MRSDRRAVTSTLGIMMLLAVTVGVVATASVNLRSQSEERPAELAPLTAVVDDTGASMRLLHHAHDAYDLGRVRAIVRTDQTTAYTGMLGTPGETWRNGHPLRVDMTLPLTPGSLVTITLIDAPTGRVLSSATLPVPRAGALAAAPPVTFQLFANGSQTPPSFKPTSTMHLEAVVDSPAGRSLIRYVDADLSPIGGPGWVALRDDGTGGDVSGGDGIYSATVLIPPRAPPGPHTLTARTVDIEGRTSFSTLTVLIARPLPLPLPLLTVLDPAASTAIRTSGSGCIQVAGNIRVNSTASDAISSSSSGCPGFEPYSIVALQGGTISTPGGSTADCCSPAPIADGPAADPFADILLPTFSAGSWYVDGVPQPARTIPRDGTPLQPGVYTGDLSVGSPYTMAPGVYIVDGGKFGTSGSGSLQGEGVFVYVTASSGSCKGVTVSGGSFVNLTAPTSGPFMGVTIAQKRGCTASSTISGGGDLQLSGGLYLPGGKLTLSGGSTMTLLRAAIVASTVTVSGGGFSLMDP